MTDLVYNGACLSLAAALGAKVGLLHLGTVRARLITDDMKRESEGGKVWEEDQEINSYVVQFFKATLLAYGPTPAVSRFTGVVHNIVENEPFFLALAVGLGALGTPPPWATTCLYAYGASRCKTASELSLLAFTDICGICVDAVLYCHDTGLSAFKTFCCLSQMRTPSYSLWAFHNQHGRSLIWAAKHVCSVSRAQSFTTEHEAGIC